ncbi:hypothetical protein [Streptomyces sp. NPDC059092]
MIPAGYDRTPTIPACEPQYVYQGLDPGASGDYDTLPRRLGLLTRTNSAC